MHIYIYFLHNRRFWSEVNTNACSVSPGFVFTYPDTYFDAEPYDLRCATLAGHGYLQQICDG